MGRGWKGEALENEGAVMVTPAYFCAALCRSGKESLAVLYGIGEVKQSIVHPSGFLLLEGRLCSVLQR